MSRLAVKEYLRAQIAGAQASIVANTNYTKVDVFRQVPKFEKLGTGLFVVIGKVESKEARLAGARTLGSKKVDYTVRLWLLGVNKDEASGGDDFDTASENLSETLRTLNGTSGAVQITDPSTASQTWFLGLGEEIEDVVDEPTLGAQQGQVRFFSEKTIHAFEQIVG